RRRRRSPPPPAITQFQPAGKVSITGIASRLLLIALAGRDVPVPAALLAIRAVRELRERTGAAAPGWRTRRTRRVLVQRTTGGAAARRAAAARAAAGRVVDARAARSAARAASRGAAGSAATAGAARPLRCHEGRSQSDHDHQEREQDLLHETVL